MGKGSERNSPCTCGSGKKYKVCCGSIANQKATLSHAFAAPIEFVEDRYMPDLGGWHDLYIRSTPMGNVGFIVPSLRANMHPELLRALKVRRQADFKGVCPECGVIQNPDWQSPGTIRRSEMKHEAGCVAQNDSIAEIIGRVGLDESGRRLDDSEVE